MENSTDVCCPEFDPAQWDEKIHVWKDKLFLQDEVRQFMHIPFNMSSVVKRMFKKIEEADAAPEPQKFLLLAYDPSPWKSELYMTITKPVPNGKTTKLPGTYISKVYDGPYDHVPRWIKNMDAYLALDKQKALKYYFHFAYCPKCMKKYGHNYCIVFAKVR